MFSNLLSSLQLPGADEAKQEDSAQGSSTGQAADSSNKGQHVSFWGVAAAVAGTVRATADDFVNTVKQTDWQSELKNFGKEVAQDTKSLSNNAVTLVDQLPLHLDTTSDEVYTGEGSEHFRSSSPNKESEDAVAAKLEEVGSALATFGRTLMAGTQELVEQVREAVETEIVAVVKDQKPGQRPRSMGTAGSSSRLATSSSGKYNRFEAEVTAMQRDSSTYCDEPEDKEDFAAWRAGFQLASMKSEINRVVKQNAFMAELQSRIVPLIVEYDDFWTRYFYRLHKLQQKEAQRQELHSRMSKADDVEVGWDDDEAPAASRPTADKLSPAVDAPSTAAAETNAPAATPSQPKPTPQTALNPIKSDVPDTPGHNDTQPITAAPAADTAALAEKLVASTSPAGIAVNETPAAAQSTVSSSAGTVAAAPAPAAPHASEAGVEKGAGVASVQAAEVKPESAVAHEVAAAAATAVFASAAPSGETAQILEGDAVGDSPVVTPASESGQTTPTPAAPTSIEGVPCKPAVAVDREGSNPDTASDITSPEWCVISNASASDAGVNSIDNRTDRDAHAVGTLSELKDDEDDDELAVTPGEVAPGDDDDEEVDEDWGNWG